MASTVTPSLEIRDLALGISTEGVASLLTGGPVAVRVSGFSIEVSEATLQGLLAHLVASARLESAALALQPGQAAFDATSNGRALHLDLPLGEVRVRIGAGGLLVTGGHGGAGNA